jgi:hypothetical protein
MPAQIAAQHRHSLLQRLDSLLDVRDMRSKRDTNYVSRPDKHWTLRLINNISGTNFNLRLVDGSYDSNSVYYFRFKDPIRHTMTLSANYRGLAVALAFNPASMFGKKTSTEINVNSYGNHFGFDFIYETNGKFNSVIEADGVEFELGSFVREKSLTINAYYAFNGNKFSYPAAFSQSYVQKRSAGSLMAGISYHRGSVTLMDDRKKNVYEYENEYENKYYDTNDFEKIKMSYASIGVGYGYNYVPSRNWVLHISALPSIVFWRENKLIKTISSELMKATFPEVTIVARASVVHYFKHFFMGLTMVYNHTSAGDYDYLRLTHNKWRARLIIGKRF